MRQPLIQRPCSPAAVAQRPPCPPARTVARSRLRGWLASSDVTGSDVLEVGQLVRVRGQQWVVSDLSVSRLPADELAPTVLPGRTLLTLTSVSEDDLG